MAGTAQWMAAARAVESRRPDRLFDDPWAALLAGRSGFAALEQQGGAGNPFLALRTWWLDAWCAEAVADGLVQVVLLAAGLDTRAYRLAWSPETVVYELDRPSVLAYKQTLLGTARAEPRCTRHAVGADLAGEWAAPLLDTGFDPTTPTCWLVEGLLFYLDPVAAHRVLTRAAELSAPGSRLAGDLVGTSLLASSTMQPMLQGLEQARTPFRFGTDEPAQFLTSTGWEPEVVAHPRDVSPGSRPWPYANPPADAPRAYLVSATRPEPTA